MKNTILILSLVLVSQARASFNSDVEGRSVRCTALQTVVIINQARTQISVIDAYNVAHPEVYVVSKDNRQSDGDTFVTYQGVDRFSNPEQTVELAFDDQGDTLTYKGKAPIELKCP